MDVESIDGYVFHFGFLHRGALSVGDHIKLEVMIKCHWMDVEMEDSDCSSQRCICVYILIKTHDCSCVSVATAPVVYVYPRR